MSITELDNEEKTNWKNNKSQTVHPVTHVMATLGTTTVK